MLTVWQSQSTTNPRWLRSKQSFPPTI